MKKVLTFLTAAISAAALVSCANGNPAPEAPQQETETIGTEAPLPEGKVGTDEFDVTLLKDSTATDGTRILTVEPTNVCSKKIIISVKDGIIENVTYIGGCDGNTQGVSRLVEGMKIQDAIDKLKGIDCGGKGTSCPDQLARALQILK